MDIAGQRKMLQKALLKVIKVKVLAIEAKTWSKWSRGLSMR